ncbi:bi-domain-containing oxidoreductase [Phenylobacterium sp.]|uniref:bi-domain-containing oxidoreductase n=1 Tax=Phenylobacterium sp. TaxID=1871053 RepID=UPI0030F394AA
MRQVIQSLADGSIEGANVPAPSARRGGLLIETAATLVSAGTERMLLEFGKGNLLEKAMQQPHRVKEVLSKARTDGVLETLEAVRSKLDQPIPLGYCNAGRVVEVGAGVEGFRVGDRVVSNGPHAEIVAVPNTLCARIPDGVSDEAAAFTPLAAIALQGIRLTEPTLGERVAVFGLGLIGLMAVQILRANGCRVLGLDFDKRKLALAQGFGAEVVDLSAGEDAVARGMAFSDGRGVDAVIIAASTKSNDLVSQAAKMSRKRGRIVLIGVVGLELDRADFYEKELSFQVSCSYGPGRYDPDYEDRAQDYPFGFVRWTEQRNFEAVLDLMAAGSLKVDELITHRFPITEAPKAYAALTDDAQAMGIVLTYPSEAAEATAAKLVRSVPLGGAERGASRARLGVIGAGQFASRVLIPAMKAGGADLVTVTSQGGLSALVNGRKNGFAEASTDVEAVLSDPGLDAIIIATRHDSHAALAERALLAGKSIFVEKPLALTEPELDRISEAAQPREGGGAPIVMVGFNRRFAPLAVRMKALLGQVAEPKTFIATVNAGAIPTDHWTQDPQVGGGRIVGEACHFVDLLRFLAGAPIVRMHAVKLGKPAAGVAEDKATLVLEFADGSHGTIHYFANGSKDFPKERIEAFGGGRILQLDNFRTLRGWGWPGFTKLSRRQDKGHAACAAAFVSALKTGGAPPIPLDEVMEVSRWSVRAARFDD